MIDLEKAYEHIVHPYLWSMGAKHHFNLRLLRFLTALYGGPRVVVVNGVATHTVLANMASVLAGCAHATALMKLTLVDSLEVVVARWPSVNAAVVVDDTQLQMVGRPGAVRFCIMEAPREFREHIESVAGMIVSVGKLEFVTNSAEIYDAVKRKQVLRHTLRKHTRNLGVDYACGRKLMCKVVNKRLLSARARLPMLKRLRNVCARVARLVSTGLVSVTALASWA